MIEFVFEFGPFLGAIGGAAYAILLAQKESITDIEKRLFDSVAEKRD